jgi:hypothetical protein
MRSIAMRELKSGEPWSAAILVCIALAGCATDGTNEERRRPTDSDFVTGSRMPQRDRAGVSTMSREEWERAAERASMPAKER